MTTALTLYNTNANSGTLATTAKKLLENPSTGATASNLNTNLTSGTTGWVELWSFGNGTAQTGAGSEPAPTGQGWIDDATTLEGNHFVSGTWTWTVELETTTTGTFVCDIHCRAYQRSSGGTYTLITEGTLTGQTVISTAYTQFTVTSAGASASNSFATGDKLYTDVIINITTNGTTGNMRVHMANSSTLGYVNVAVVSPGYISVTTASRTATSSAVLQATLSRTATDSAVLQSTSKRNAASSAVLLSTLSRLAPSSAVIAGARAAPTSAVLLATLSRTATSSATLTVTRSRSATASATLYNPGVFFASSVAQTIPGLILSNQMPQTFGGVETSVTVTAPASGTGTYVELLSQGGTSAGTLALPAPTGLGWATNAIDGYTICAGNYWSNWTLAKGGTAMSGATLLVRYSRRTMDGTYYTIAIATLAGQTFSTKATYLLPTQNTNKPFQLISGDTFYVDVFVYNGSTAWSSDVFTVYVSNSASIGVVNDGEIFTPQILQTATGLTYLCSIPNFQINNALPVSNQAFNLVDALDQRSILNLTGEDALGTASTPRGTPVILSDYDQGLLYTGNVQSDEMEKVTVGSNTQIEHMHTDHDNHYWFDKEPNTTNYANWYSGDIVCDFLQKLASEGVTGQYAIESDYTPTTFGQGTLTGVVATTTTSPFTYAPNTATPPTTTNTGDLELVRAGTQFTLTEATTTDFSSGTLTGIAASNNMLTPTTQSALKMTVIYSPTVAAQNVPATESGGIQTSGSNSSNIARFQFWTGSQVIAANDTFNYDVWISSTSPAFLCGISFKCTDGTVLDALVGTLDTTTDLGVFDQNGVSVDNLQDLSAYATDTWYTRNISLSSISGKTIKGVYAYTSGSAAGNYTFFIKNCYLGSASGSPFFGTAATAPQTNPPTTSGIGGYLLNTISTSVVKVFNPLTSNRVSPAHSISGVGLVQNSTITWIASLPTSGIAATTYPPGTTTSGTTGSSGVSPAMVLMVSYDNTTWLLCQNNQALPGLPPGSNVAGLSLYLREQFAAGSDPSAIPSLEQVQITINSAANASVSDIVTAYGTSTAWNTGTNVLTGPNSSEDLTLGSSSNPFTQSWFNGVTYNQTFFAGANNSGTDSAASGTYAITAGAQATGGTWCQTRFDMVGFFQNGTIEADIKTGTSNSNMDILYRETGWGNANNNFAYVCSLNANGSSGSISFGYGSNNYNNTAGTYTNVKSVTTTINSNTFYHIKIVVNGNRHTFYFNNSLTASIDILDNAYPAAGNIGYRTYYGGTSSNTASIKNLSVVTTTFGTWTSPATSLTALGTCGYSQVCWTDLTSQGQIEATTEVLASIDGGTTWMPCANGAEIPQLARGTNVSGASLVFQMILLSSTPPVSTPIIMGLYARVCGNYGTVSGTRISPVLSLSPVTYESSSNAMYNSNTPTGTSIAVSTSTNAGSSWEAVANSGAGAALSYWTPQPSPTQDLFGTNTLANYTNTSKTGGTTASVLYTTAQSQLSLSGGTFGLYVSNAPTSVGDIDVACCLSQSDTGGLVWHYVNGSNYYELVAQDASSSGGSPNTLQLYKVSSNVRTLLATASITFTRGTFHITKSVMKGKLINAYWDGHCVLSYLDTSPVASGMAGLSNNGGTALFYQLWIQPLGTNLSGVGLQTKVVLSTSDPQYMPQLFVLSCAIRGPHITQGVQIYQMHPLTVPFASYYSTEMDQLAQADGDSFWYVDKYGECLFTSRYARLGAFPLQTTTDPANASGSLLYTPATKVSTSSDTFRNQQIITNVTTLITPPIEYKVADGTATSWTLGYPVYSTPIITFITGGQPATVGVQGIDSGRQFYWQPGSPTLSYDSSLPVLPIGTVFSVQYVGQSTNNVVVNNSTSQATQAILEGNTGIVCEIETALRSTTIGMTTAQATAFANGLLNRNGISNAIEVLGTIMYGGLKPGTFVPVFAPEFGVWNAQLPIIKITTTALPAATGLPVYQYLVDATNGSNVSQWQRVFGIA